MPRGNSPTHRLRHSNCTFPLFPLIKVAFIYLQTERRPLMHSFRDAHEDVLCKRCAEGDREAWEKLVTEYGMPMRDLMARLLGSARHRALDDVFLEFWWILFKDHCLVLRRFQEKKGTLTAYFSGVARNLVRKNLHRESSRAKRQISLSGCTPDDFPIDDLPLMQVINELESQATNA